MPERYTVSNIISGIGITLVSFFWFYMYVVVMMVAKRWWYSNRERLLSSTHFIIDLMCICASASSSKWPCWTCCIYLCVCVLVFSICFVCYIVANFKDLPTWTVSLGHNPIVSQGSESSANFFLPMLQAAAVWGRGCGISLLGEDLRVSWEPLHNLEIIEIWYNTMKLCIFV